MDDQRIVKAPFSIDSWEETAYDEPASGPQLTHVTIRKTYTGAIEGSSTTRVLTAQGGSGSGYVASERVVGSLEGRAGSFVIQHGGLVDDQGRQRTFGSTIPGSGTDDLADLSGEAVEAEHEVLTLRLRTTNEQQR